LFRRMERFIIYVKIYIFVYMVEGQPKLFENWDPYMKARQVMASAAIFKNHGWYQWQSGHAKLFGVLLWDYETKRKRKFKYSKTLRKQGYCRTHNYRLLKDIIRNNLLEKEGKGHYSFTLPELEVIRRVVARIREIDTIGSKKMPAGKEQKSESTVS
jgi:hypothetical protein